MNNKYKNGHSRRDSLRKARRRDEHAIYSYLEKLRRGCELTGRALDPDDLDWHHLDPLKKKRTICKMLALGHKQFLTEIWSCQCIGRDVHRAMHKFPEKSVSEILKGLKLGVGNL